MKKPVSMCLAILMCLSLGSSIVNAEKTDNSKITRISGINRVETSVLVSKKTFKNAENVIIASGNVFQDALSGSILSQNLDAPILLTDGDTLDKKVFDEIKRLNVKNIYILGGVKSVSSEIERSLKGKYNIDRISGKDRYETSLKISNILKEKFGYKDIALASGKVFSDSLSASSAMANKKVAILLVDGVNLPKIDKNRIKYIFGGEKTIKIDVPGAVRIAGANRYETSVKIAKKFYTNESNYILTSGESYSDALVASVLAYKNNAHILLTEGGKLNKYIEDNIELKNKSFIIVGGKESVKEVVETKVKELSLKDDNSLKIDNKYISTGSSLRKEVVNTVTSNFDKKLPSDNKDSVTDGTLPSDNKDSVTDGTLPSNNKDSITEEIKKYSGVSDSYQYEGKKNEIVLSIRNDGKIVNAEINSNNYGDDIIEGGTNWFNFANEITKYITSPEMIDKLISSIDRIDNLAKEVVKQPVENRGAKLAELLGIQLSPQDIDRVNVKAHVRSAIAEIYAKNNDIKVDAVAGATKSKRSLLNAAKKAYESYLSGVKKQYKQIEAYREPKVTYQPGESLDLNSLVVYLVKNDGKKIEVPYSKFAEYNISTNFENGKVFDSVGRENLVITHNDSQTSVSYPIEIKVNIEDIYINKLKLKLDGDQEYREFDLNTDKFKHSIDINEGILGKNITELILEDNKGRQANIKNYYIESSTKPLDFDSIKNINNLEYDFTIVLEDTETMKTSNESYRFKDIAIHIHSIPVHDMSKLSWVILDPTSRVIDTIYKETPVDYSGLILQLLDADDNILYTVPYDKFDEYGIKILPEEGYPIEGTDYANKTEVKLKLSIKGANMDSDILFKSDKQSENIVSIKNGKDPNAPDKGNSASTEHDH